MELAVIGAGLPTRPGGGWCFAKSRHANSRSCSMRNTLGSLVAIAAVFAAAPTARADVDDQCLQRWVQTFAASTVGLQCRWLTNNDYAKLNAAQDRSLTCAQSAATDAEKDVIASLLDATKADVTKALTNVPCSDDALGFYRSQVQGSGN
jgi:hypothetical protein